MLAELFGDAMEGKEFQYYLDNKDKKYLFAFLDILGYSSKIKVRANEDNLGDFIGDVMALEEECVPNALNLVKNKEGLVSKVQTMIFSDSFCLYWEIGDYAESDTNITEEQFQILFRDVIDFISNIQCSALNHNILFRGAFSIGRHYKYGDVTVSEALVKAHDAEGYTIKNPRIGFDISVENEFLNNSEFIQNLIQEKRLKMDGNILYIDYLQLLQRINTWHPLNKVVEKMTVSNNKQCYFENIKLIDADVSIKESSKEGIFNKYRWLKSYHNEKCKELGYPDLIIE